MDPNNQAQGLQVKRLSEHFTHCSKSKALQMVRQKQFFAIRIYSWHVLTLANLVKPGLKSDLKATKVIDLYNTDKFKDRRHTAYRHIKMCKFFAFRINSWFVLQRPKPDSCTD